MSKLLDLAQGGETPLVLIQVNLNSNALFPLPEVLKTLSGPGAALFRQSWRCCGEAGGPVAASGEAGAHAGVGVDEGAGAGASAREGEGEGKDEDAGAGAGRSGAVGAGVFSSTPRPY